jgi:hypothetical protein
MIFTPSIVQAEPRYQQKMSWPLTYKAHLGEPQEQPFWNLDGKDWYEAEAPPRVHQHWAQSVGQLDGPFDEVWRCPCGAIGGPREPWVLLDKRRTRSDDKPSFWRRYLAGLFGIRAGSAGSVTPERGEPDAAR